MPCCQNHLEDLLVDGRIILKWTCKKEDKESKLDWYCSGQEEVAASYKRSNENSGSIQYKEFCDCWGTVRVSRRILLHGVIYLFIYLVAYFVFISWGMVHGQGQIFTLFSFWHVYVLWLGVYWWNVMSECPTAWRQTVTRRDVRPSHEGKDSLNESSTR